MTAVECGLLRYSNSNHLFRFGIAPVIVEVFRSHELVEVLVVIKSHARYSGSAGSRFVYFGYHVNRLMQGRVILLANLTYKCETYMSNTR